MDDIKIDGLDIDVDDIGREDNASPGPQQTTPMFVSWGPYRMNADGLTVTLKPDDPDEKRALVSAPFEVLGRARDPEGQGWGRYLRWRDPDGRTHLQLVPDASLHGECAALYASLAEGGLAIALSRGKSPKSLAAYLAGCDTGERVTIVHRTGWHEIGGNRVFVLPAETIGCDNDDRVVLHGIGNAAAAYEARGTLADWQAGVGAMAGQHGLAVLAISAAFAGPLFHLAGQEGGGLHCVGQSSMGKTTLLQCAASVWGKGGTPGYVRSWRATSNGLEGVAAASTDTALILDELSQVDAKDAGASLYMLSNGSGKSRAARDGSLREPKTWCVLTLSSGEIPTETKLLEDRGRKPQAGQMVRMLDIPVDRGFGFGAFDGGGPDGDAGKLAQTFKQAAMAAYGTAGPEFVRLILAENISPGDLRELVEAFVAEHVPVNADGQIIRAAQRFGLVAAAGELATMLGVTPWHDGAAREAAAWALAQWIELRGGTQSAESRQAIEQVRLVIEQHGEARFQCLDDTDARPVNNRLGWRKGEGNKREWWVPPQVWKSEICVGIDPLFTARILAEQEVLVRSSDGFQPVRRIGGRSVRVYVLNAKIVDGGSDAP